MTEDHDFAAVDHFTVGAVGPPGQRIFLIQARSDADLVTVKAEKQQVAALAEYLQGVLADLPDATDEAPVPLDLEAPHEPAWVAGTVSVAYDDVADRIVIQVEEIGPPDEEDDDLVVPDRSTLRVRLTRRQVAALIEHTADLVRSGRPPCPICGHPRGPEHACPRTNGHGPPS